MIYNFAVEADIGNVVMKQKHHKRTEKKHGFRKVIERKETFFAFLQLMLVCALLFRITTHLHSQESRRK